jgi:hypothetical protein
MLGSRERRAEPKTRSKYHRTLKSTKSRRWLATVTASWRCPALTRRRPWSDFRDLPVSPYPRSPPANGPADRGRAFGHEKASSQQPQQLRHVDRDPPRRGAAQMRQLNYLGCCKFITTQSALRSVVASSRDVELADYPQGQN